MCARACAQHPHSSGAAWEHSTAGSNPRGAFKQNQNDDLEGTQEPAHVLSGCRLSPPSRLHGPSVLSTCKKKKKKKMCLESKSHFFLSFFLFFFFSVRKILQPWPSMLHVSKLEMGEAWCPAGGAGREPSRLATPLMHSGGLVSTICVPGRGPGRKGCPVWG